MAWAAGTAVAAVAMFACYLRQSRTVAVGSDGASQALQAWDLLHGNLLLHGWWVTDVSFYTTELPQYAAIELARGLSADVMHVAGAMTYTLLVLAAALLARGRATGRAGLARALLAAGILLAPQLGAGHRARVSQPLALKVWPPITGQTFSAGGRTTWRCWRPRCSRSRPSLPPPR